MADASEPDEGGSDLFDRWLSHRRDSSGEAPRPRTYGVPRTGLGGEDSTDPGSAQAGDGTQHGAADGTQHPAADAAADTLAVAAADAAAVEPPEDGAASDGEEHRAHADTAPTEAAGPEPPVRRQPWGLDEFEPVVIASVRRQAETPVEKRSRLARFRRAGLEPDPADEAATDDGPAREAVDDVAGEHGAVGDAATPHEVTARAAVEPAPPAPGRATPVEPTPPRTEPLPGHDEPAGPGGSDPTPRTTAQPAPPSAGPGGQQDAAAEVFAAFNPGAAPTPGPTGAGGTTPATTPAAAAAAPPVPPGAPEPPRQAHRRPRRSLTSYVEAARATLDRSVRGTPEERAATSPTAPPTAGPSAGDQAAPDRTAAPDHTAAPAPAAEVGPARSTYDQLRAQREAATPPQPDVLPPSIDFRPRTLARRVTTVLLLAGLAATGVAAWRAYESRVETDIGLAAILALATGVVWAVRAGSVPTRIGLHGGVLEVRSQAGRFVFEVTGAHTRLELVGSPGRRGSRLLVHRRGLAPFAITPAMVDLRRLVEALRYYRPDL